MHVTPTHAEMAARHLAKARSFAQTARRIGVDTPRGSAMMADAESYFRIAQVLAVRAAEVLRRTR